MNKFHCFVLLLFYFENESIDRKFTFLSSIHYIESIVLAILLHKFISKVRKLAQIRNRYNQVPHPTKDTTWESDNNTTRAKRSSIFLQVTTRQQSTEAKA